MVKYTAQTMDSAPEGRLFPSSLARNRAPITGALGPLAGVLAVYVIHIAPWAVAEGIVAGAARALSAGDAPVFYGPFRRGGRHTAPSNAEFDAALRAGNPAWGVRDRDDVAELAAAAGLGPPRVTGMRASNLVAAFLQP